jgi:RHS repeat-associated protein
MGFNGERPDPLTGHYLLGNGYRAFNPVLMRFNSPDSLSPFGKGGLNAYAYALGNPVDRVDPTGHFSLKAAMLLFGGLQMMGVGVSIAGVAAKNNELGFIGMGMGLAGLGASIGSLFIGRYINTTRNIQPLFSEHLNVATATQQKLSGKRLIIDGHGNGVTVGKQHPRQLADAVQRKYPDFDADFKDVRLISCHGADGGGNSYGQQLANELGKPVKAYMGLIFSHGPLEAIQSPSFKPGQSMLITTIKTTKEYNGTLHKYAPVTFRPQIRNA